MIAVTRKRFVDRVVNDFVDEMMQTALRRTADIHTRTFADGFESFEDLDLIRAVLNVADLLHLLDVKYLVVQFLAVTAALCSSV